MSWSDTGVKHAAVHKTNCTGFIEYNGTYNCNLCGKEVSPESHPAIYTGLFNHRYPDGNFRNHPNFDRLTYEDGKRELADIKAAREND